MQHVVRSIFQWDMISLLFLLCLLCYCPVQAQEDFVLHIGQDKTITEFNFEAPMIGQIPGAPNLPVPTSASASRVGNTAQTSISANVGEQGAAIEAIGAGFSRDYGDYSIDEVAHLPAKVILDLSYSLNAQYDKLNGGEADALVISTIFQNPSRPVVPGVNYIDYVGPVAPQKVGSLSGSGQYTFTEILGQPLTVGNLPDLIHVYPQSSAVNTGDDYPADDGPHYASASLTLRSITIEFPLAAIIHADPITGDAPSLVTFTDASFGEPQTWLWEFGDGQMSTERNPIHEYSQPGSYSVQLTVGDGQNQVSTTKTISVMSPSPIANFSANPESGEYPLFVQFNDLSSGEITSWEWDFNNDGAVDSTAQNPSFIYTEPGFYSVRLKVMGPGGTESEKIEEGFIQAKFPPLEPAFSWDPIDGSAPLTVQFSDASGGEPTIWKWIFGDGGESEQQNPTHTFTEPGEYTVSLSIFKRYADSGDPITTSETISVSPGLGVVSGFVRVIRGYDQNTGVISDNIEGADIRLVPVEPHQYTRLAKTDSNGCFSIDAPVGEYTIYISFYDRGSHPFGPIQFDQSIYIDGKTPTIVNYPPNFLNARLEKDKANEAITRWNAVIKTQRWNIKKVEGVEFIFGIFLVPFNVHKALSTGIETTGEYLIQKAISIYWDETGGGDLKEAAINKLIKYCFNIEDDMIAQFERQRDDPPDPNFQQVYQLRLPDEANASVNSTDPYLTSVARLTYLGEIQDELDTALLTSYERYLGASQANDTAAMRMQLTAVVSVADAMHSNTVNYTKTVFDLRSIVQGNQSFDEFMLTGIQTRLQQEGFTADEIAALREQGLSDEGMETYKQALIAFNYSTYLSNLEGYAEISRNRDAAAKSLAEQASGVLRLMDSPSLLLPVSFPGQSSRPGDSDYDGRFEDCNGNGRPDFADVVLYFNGMEWIRLMEPISAFDYNGNGRIDFADVVWLFNHL